MPACWKCGKTQPTAEVRRTRRGHLCKDKSACSQRQAAQTIKKEDKLSA